MAVAIFKAIRKLVVSKTQTTSTQTGDIEEQIIDARGDKEQHAEGLAGAKLRAHKHKKWMKQVLTYTLGCLMLFSSLSSIVAGPDLNQVWVDNPLPEIPDRIIPPKAFEVAYATSLVVFVFSFLLYAVFGEWGGLRSYHRRCHRILFITVVVLAVLFKKTLIGDDPVMVSFAPMCLMLLAEFTCLVVVLSSKGMGLLFMSYIPWLLGKIGTAIIAIGTTFGSIVLGFGAA